MRGTGFKRNLWVMVALIVSAAAAVWAQGVKDIPGLPGELEAQLKARQTAEEAGSASGDSEANAKEKVKPKTWEEIVEQWMTPMKVHKKNIVRIDDHYAYPHASVPFKMEIVKEEGDFVWLKGLPPEDPESALYPMWMKRQEEEAQLLIKREFDEKFGPGEFLDFSIPSVPPPTIAAVDFVSAGKGLPRFEDIVLPPSRLGKVGHPTIYLGDGKGDFKYWSDAKWNPKVGFDYGDVETGDFDQDGFLDIVIAVHFRSQYILYGSENHEFRRFVKLPSPDPRVTSRAATVADFDGDGRLDVAFLAELDVDLSDSKRVKGTPTLWIVNNTENGWKLDPDAPTQFVIGDVLRSGDLDGDGRPDLILASNTSAWRAIVFFNRVDDRWATLDERHVLGNAFHFGVAPVFFSDSTGKPPVLFSAFEQFMRYEGKQQARTGIVRYDPAAADWSKITYSTIFFDDQRFNPYFRIAVGDLNGDGLDDLVASRKKGGLEVWIQTEDGSFYLNPSDSVAEADGRVYDLWITDINGDGMGDIVAAIADIDQEHIGGIRVWLSKVPS